MITTPDLVADPVETSAADPAAADELAALRRVALHNMRLLKAQIVPLIDAALRSSAAGDRDGPVDGRRARWTATALRLIDDTAIAAAAGAAGGRIAPVDFSALLRRAADRHGQRIGPVSLGTLPCLLGRGDQMRMLADEVMTGIARVAPQAAPEGVRIGWTAAGDGQGVVWLQDAGTPVPEADAPDFAGTVPVERCWSLAQNLLARMGGDFHLSRTGRGRLRLALRFPGDMVLGEAGR